MDNNYNNGYNNNGYGGGYNNNQYNNYDSNYEMPHDERRGGGFAIASFVLAIVNIIPCCSALSIITVPLCIIFSIISLVQKRKGTAFAIIGIVLSLIAGLFFAYYGFIMYKIMPDAMYFAQNQQQITEMQNLIRSITDTGLQIEGQEHRNKTAFQNYLTGARQEIKQFTTNNQTANAYYHNMANQHQTWQSYFVDQKK